jgi:hypothetical protein
MKPRPVVLVPKSAWIALLSAVAIALADCVLRRPQLEFRIVIDLLVGLLVGALLTAFRNRGP